MTTAYCTYCSADKREDAGNLPAVERYRSRRITAVREMAHVEGARFLILSGRFGLLDPNDEIPWYDHLLGSDEVEAMAGKVADTLRGLQFSSLTCFGASPDDQPAVIPYYAVLAAACSQAGIRFIVEELPRELCD